MHAPEQPVNPPSDAPLTAGEDGENHLLLTATLTGRETLRYNLSGVPVTECTLD